MSKTKVLIVTQEMEPYTVLSEISHIARKLPQHVQSKGMEIRLLMPKYGTINERRHKLHEVVRLSGMNIIVNEDDFPLIIKVASVAGARMQVYFLDNEDFFKRKFIFENDKGEAFDDNDERMIFFCKGVLETVKKFGWAPDIIHCHGWMTSLIPMYAKTAYKSEPLFQDSKVVYSMYNQEYDTKFSGDFAEKATINNLRAADLADYVEGEGVNLHKGAIAFSDALIKGSEELGATENKALEYIGEKPVLEFQTEEEYLNQYIEFYKSILEPKEEEA
ncbi:MAG: glycogen/starch synthase [Bacteroidota bacterium]